MLAMGTITAKQLKQRTGEVIKRVRSGERMTLTYRGKTVAVITPAAHDKEVGPDTTWEVEQAWRDIDLALEATEPPFEGWREATQWIRKRV